MVANHMGEQSRLQARLAALVEAELSRNATINETLIQIKQQMGGHLTRSDPYSSTEVNAPTSSRGSDAHMDDNSPELYLSTHASSLALEMLASADDVLPWMQAEVSSWKMADAYHC